MTSSYLSDSPDSFHSFLQIYSFQHHIPKVVLEGGRYGHNQAFIALIGNLRQALIQKMGCPRLWDEAQDSDFYQWVVRVFVLCFIPCYSRLGDGCIAEFLSASSSASDGSCNEIGRIHEESPPVKGTMMSGAEPAPTCSPTRPNLRPLPGLVGPSPLRNFSNGMHQGDDIPLEHRQKANPLRCRGCCFHNISIVNRCAIDCYNMLSICIVERWKGWGTNLFAFAWFISKHHHPPVEECHLHSVAEKPYNRESV
jgi:hypothetical protein